MALTLCLNVDAYIHSNPTNYIQHHVSTIYSVRYENNLIGYFTLSMSSIGRRDVLDNDTLSVPFSDYPALLLGQMGIDINYRGNKIGQRICSFCSGMRQELDKKTACAFLILRTTAQLARGYYEPKCRFRWKPKNEGKVWMYRKLF